MEKRLQNNVLTTNVGACPNGLGLEPTQDRPPDPDHMTPAILPKLPGVLAPKPKKTPSTPRPPHQPQTGQEITTRGTTSPGMRNMPKWAMLKQGRSMKAWMSQQGCPRLPRTPDPPRESTLASKTVPQSRKVGSRCSQRLEESKSETDEDDSSSMNQRKGKGGWKASSDSSGIPGDPLGPPDMV